MTAWRQRLRAAGLPAAGAPPAASSASRAAVAARIAPYRKRGKVVMGAGAAACCGSGVVAVRLDPNDPTAIRLGLPRASARSAAPSGWSFRRRSARRTRASRAPSGDPATAIGFVSARPRRPEVVAAIRTGAGDAARSAPFTREPALSATARATGRSPSPDRQYVKRFPQ